MKSKVEISLSGRLNTFVGNVFLGQCLEIIISLFKGWNFMFYYWSLMFGMYLKQFWSVSSFEISSWTFLCDYFFLCVPGTLIDKSCLHKLHVIDWCIFWLLSFWNSWLQVVVEWKISQEELMGKHNKGGTFQEKKFHLRFTKFRKILPIHFSAKKI